MGNAITILQEQIQDVYSAQLSIQEFIEEGSLLEQLIEGEF